VKARIVLILLVFCFKCSGQTNLVVNPSFELIDTCPYSQDQLHFAQPWFKPTPSTPDLYNTCGSAVSCSVPSNWTGWQQPRTGNGYAGFAAYGCLDCREYISAPLSDSLKFGHNYCVEFYVSLADASYWANNRIGLYISNFAPINDGQIDTITALPQFFADTNQLFLDTINWVKVSGTYSAIGGEKYITIGNFFADNQTATIGNMGSFMWCYYYIDDVAVYELAPFEAGDDRVICLNDSVQLGAVGRSGVTYSWSPSTGLSNSNIPNPKAAPEHTTTYILTQTECDAVLQDTVTIVVDRTCHAANTLFIPTVVFTTQPLFVSGLESGSKIEVFDAQGKLVYRSFNYENNFHLQQLNAGVYIAVLSAPSGSVYSQKIVVLAAD